MIKNKEFLLVLALLSVMAYQNTATAQTLGGRVLPPGSDVNSSITVPEVGPTGTAIISLPLWQINLRALSFPVELNYITSGVRVNETAGSVGLGWSLNTGGLLSRSVSGFPDEYNDDLSIDYQGWFGLDTDLSGLCDLTSLANFHEGNWDFSPDIFSFNIPGSGGTFLFYTDSTINFTTPTAVEIIADFNGYSSSFLDSTSLDIYYTGHIDFEILDAQGNKFIFQPVKVVASVVTQTMEETNNSSSESDLGFTAHQHSVADAVYVSEWGLKRIITALGEEITFQYDHYEYSVADYPIGRVYTRSNIPSCLPGGGDSREEYWVTKLREDVIIMLPTSITTPSEKIHFLYDDDTNLTTMQRKLTTVKVEDLYSGDQVAIYELNQSYYSGDQRLRLDGLDVYGAGGHSSPLDYEFKYIDGIMQPMGSMQQDFYGYNNANSVEHMMPFMNITSGDLYLFDYTSADRTPDSDSIKVGTLEKIIYPSGGSLLLAYQTNTEPSGSNLKIAPGLRVSSIEVKNTNDITTEKHTYTYSDLIGYYLSPDGVFYSYPPTGGANRFYETPFSTPDPFYDYARYSSSPHGRYQWPIMSGFGYSSIKHESLSGDNTIGSMILSNYELTTSLRSYIPRLRSLEYYEIPTGYPSVDADLVRRESYTYDYIEEKTVIGLRKGYAYPFEGGYYECGTTQVFSNPCLGQGKMYYSMEGETFHIKPFLISKHKVEEFPSDGASAIKNESIYSYNTGNNLFLPDTIIRNSYPSGSATPFETTTINRRYAADYDINNGPPAIKDLIEEGLRSLLTEEWTVRNGKLIEATAYYYNENGQPDTISRYTGVIKDVPNTVWSDQTGFNVSNIPMSNDRTVIYDTCGNPTVVTTRQGNEVTLWGYREQLPIARVSNLSDPQSFYYTSFEEDDDNPAVIEDHQEGGKTGQHYLNLTGSYQTTRNMPVGDYMITYFHRNTVNDPWTLQVEQQSLLTTGTIVTGKTTGHIDELRIYPPGSRVETSTYKPLTGATSQTDANANSVYYRYDHFGRLVLIRNNRGEIIRSINYNTGR